MYIESFSLEIFIYFSEILLVAHISDTNEF